MQDESKIEAARKAAEEAARRVALAASKANSQKMMQKRMQVLRLLVLSCQKSLAIIQFREQRQRLQ